MNQQSNTAYNHKNRYFPNIFDHIYLSTKVGPTRPKIQNLSFSHIFGATKQNIIKNFIPVLPFQICRLTSPLKSTQKPWL